MLFNAVSIFNTVRKKTNLNRFYKISKIKTFLSVSKREKELTQCLVHKREKKMQESIYKREKKLETLLSRQHIVNCLSVYLTKKTRLK